MSNILLNIMSKQSAILKGGLSSEHRGLSARSGIPILNPSHSNIRSYVLDTGHEMNQKHFKINQSNTSANLRMSESILIHKFKHSLNSMVSGNSPLISYFV